MAVTRAYIDQADMLSASSVLSAAFHECWLSHDFESQPVLDKFLYQEQYLDLKYYIYKQMGADEKVFYLLLDRNLLELPELPYPSYPIYALILEKNDKYFVYKAPLPTQYIVITDEIDLNHLTKQQHRLLYKVCEAVIKEDGSNAFLHRSQEVSILMNGISFTIKLNLSAPMIATRVNRNPIGRESQYRWRVLGRMLGEGGYGRVYDASLKFIPNNSKQQFDVMRTPVVFKFMPNQGKRLNEFLVHEHAMLTRAGAKPKRLTTYCDRKWGDVTVLGMRRYPGQDYFDLAHGEFIGSRLLTAEQRLYVAIGSAEKIKKIHERGIIHKDLKDSNVMVDENDWNVELIDFGLADCVDVPAEIAVGTQGFIAPEVLLENRYSFKSDIFSYSCFLRIILNVMAKKPFGDIIDRLEKDLEALKRRGNSDAEKNQLLGNIFDCYYRQASVTSTVELIHPQVQDVNAEQKARLKALYEQAHHVHPELRPSINEIITELNHILLSVLVSSYPLERKKWEAIFKSGYYFKKKLTKFENQAFDAENIQKLLSVFKKKADKLPDVVDMHFARLLNIKVFESASTKDDILDIINKLESDFLSTSTRLRKYQSKTADSNHGKFRGDVGRVRQRIYSFDELTIDNIAKLVSQLKKDLCLLDRYYFEGAGFFSPAAPSVGDGGKKRVPRQYA